MIHAHRSCLRIAYLPFIVLLGCLTGTATHADELGNRVDSIISRVDLGVAKIGLVAVNLSTKNIMIERNADQPMIPASNLKLVTTAASLSTFGPGFELKTTLERVGRDLVIRGEGDPGFGDPALLMASGLKVEDLINLWVEAAKKAADPDGYDHLLIDDRIFDHEELVHPDDGLTIN